MSRLFVSLLWALPLLLLPGCSHPGAVPSRIAAVPAAPPPPVMPAPIVLDGRKAPNVPADTDPNGLPAGDSNASQGDQPGPQADSSFRDPPPRRPNLSTREGIMEAYDHLTAQREDVQAQRTAIYQRYNSCPEGSPCQANLDDKLWQLGQTEISLGTQQAQLAERLKAVVGTEQSQQ